MSGRGMRDGTEKYLGKKAVVVGAGPAGGIAAAFLAKEGFDVTVWKKPQCLCLCKRWMDL